MEIAEKTKTYHKGMFPEYYPPWEPPVSRLRATWEFPP